MVLSLFALVADPTNAVKESQIAIENAFRQILDEEYSFRDFSSEKSFLAELSKSVSDDSIIVACAEPIFFKAFKNFIANAFQHKMKPSKAIGSLIEFVHPDASNETIQEQSLIPQGATPLVTQDGFYSGYGIKAKNQLLIVLPLDVKRIDYIINNSLMAFVRENMDLAVLTSDPLEGMTVEDSPLSQYEDTTRKPDSLYDALFIEKVVKKLKTLDLSVSLANTKTIDFIANISTTEVDVSEVVFLSSYMTEKGTLSAREYAIALAKGALADSTCDIGAAITKVFSMRDEAGNPFYFLYVSVADKESANVAKFTAEPDETPPQLIYRAVEELFRMLAVWMETNYSVPQVVDKKAPKKASNKAQNNTEIASVPELTKLKIVVASMMGASAIISLIVSFL